MSVVHRAGDGSAVADQWQLRLDRLRRRLPLPLLVVSALAAVVSAAGRQSWTRLVEVGVPVTVVAAAWWTLATVRPYAEGTITWRRWVFGVHTVAAGVLVWVDPTFGIFAYAGFLLAYGLGDRWRTVGSSATALIVAAAISDGYPSDAGDLLGYTLVAAVLLVLVLNSASITRRAVEQNVDRGRVITELGEANRRLEAALRENAALHAQLVVQARETGIVDERRRLAGEIHDTLAQGLTGIIAQLEAAEHTQSSRHLDEARSLARSSLAEARRSVQALRPEQLESASLPTALAELVRTWTRQSGITAELDVVGVPVPADPEVDAALFRVAQESLTNVAKHADAVRVRVTLTYTDDALLLDVVDDGRGFEPCGPTHGYGLVAMAQRLERVDGRLTVDSTPGRGTTVNAALAWIVR